MSKEKADRTLGTHIAHLVHVLALKKQWSKAYTTQHIAEAAGFGADIVYKWRQNRLTPSDETLLTLLRIGRAEANLQRNWGLEVVKAARHPEGAALVDELWEPQPQKEIPHNLPKPTYAAFFGRTEEQHQLLSLLSTENADPLITINGIGGVGKTALTIKTAYHCLEASINPFANNDCPTFSVIIFVSAKQKYLTAAGILPRAYAPTTLRAIYREIAFVLDIDTTRIAPDDLAAHLRHALGRQQTLLIVDNLETVEDKDSVLAFLYDLPPSVKVVVTTREQRCYSPIQLDYLSPTEGRSLIRYEATRQQLQLSDEEIAILYQGAGGIPAALIYGVGQLAAGRNLDNVLERLSDHEGDLARFFFHDSVAPLRGRPAHRLLMAIALFARRPTTAFAFGVAGLDEASTTANDALVQLLRLALVTQQQEQFIIHPLTREYTLAELETHIEFELDARKRLLTLYRDFVSTFGKLDAGEWQQQYQTLEREWENVYALLEWCMQHHRYEEVRHFWQQLRGFLLLYGHTEDRLTLLHWLQQESERHGDQRTQGEILYQLAGALMNMGRADQLQQAGDLLQQAWTLRTYLNPEIQSYIADGLAAWHIRHNQFADANHWLDTAETILPQIKGEEAQRCRKALHTRYRRAIGAAKAGQLQRAQTLFSAVQQECQAIGWHRLNYYAQNWLADLALATGDLITADRLLREGLPIVEQHRDQRRLAFYKRSLAALAAAQHDWSMAERWYREAEAGFDRLGMAQEAEACRAWQHKQAPSNAET